MAPRFSLSVQTILLSGFCGLSAVGIGLALFLGLAAAAQNTRELLTENLERFVDRMATEVEARLSPVEQRTQWIVERVKDESIDVQLPISKATEFFFHTILETTPAANAIALITKDGQFRGWLRDQPGIIREDWSQNPKVVEWLASGDTDPETEWSPPIWIESQESAVIVYQTPLTGPEGYIGYLTYTLPVSDFSRSLARIDKNAFILVGEDEVLAHPLMIDWRPLENAVLPPPSVIYDSQSALIPLQELGDPILEQIWSTEKLGFGLGRSVKNREFNARITTLDDREFVFIYRSLTGFGEKPLTVGTYIDSNAEDEVFDRMGAAAAAGGVVILVALVLGLFVARVIGQPVRALATASSVVETGQLDQVPALPRSHVSELNKAVTSFEGMVRGLMEKEVIRQTLGRYVPESIAEQLLKDDGSLQPIEAEATILFCDLAGFTSLTEQLGPTRIVKMLNAYFSRMTEIIEAEGGVITQFQGDAILAIFNVPIKALDHPERACRAAVKMRHIVKHENFAGQSITSRVGINTGPVVAGAVGAEGRLTYTVHGDAVNRAARVEAMNKETGTTILITEATARRVQSVALKEVGNLIVRGQTGVVTVFTIDE